MGGTYLKDCRTPDFGDRLETVEAKRPEEAGKWMQDDPLPCEQPATCPDSHTANTYTIRRGRQAKLQGRPSMTKESHE